MKKSSGVRLQELPLSLPLAAAAIQTPVEAFSPSLSLPLSIPLSPFTKCSSLNHPLFLSLSLHSISFVCPVTESSLSLLLPSLIFLSVSTLLSTALSLFPSLQGWSVWYYFCAVGQQNGLKKGQAPQTTLIYRTAFQSLHCCSTYPTNGRQTQKGEKRKKDTKNRVGWKQNGKGHLLNFVKLHCQCFANMVKHVKLISFLKAYQVPAHCVWHTS